MQLNISKKHIFCAVTVDFNPKMLLSHRANVFNPELDRMLRTKFGAGLPTMSELEQKTAIAFVNTNPTFNIPAPLPENVIPVGGMHIKDTKPLPKVKHRILATKFEPEFDAIVNFQDLERFIESSIKGAVVFSLGTNVRSALMDLEKQKTLLDAFEAFPEYHFLWKFEEPIIDLKLPKNVMIRPWLPQSDILAHKKVKAFFSHSGLNQIVYILIFGICHLNMSSFYRNVKHTGSNLERCSNFRHAIRMGSTFSNIF